MHASLLIWTSLGHCHSGIVKPQPECCQSLTASPTHAFGTPTHCSTDCHSLLSCIWTGQEASERLPGSNASQPQLPKAHNSAAEAASAERDTWPFQASATPSDRAGAAGQLAPDPPDPSQTPPLDPRAPQGPPQDHTAYNPLLGQTLGQDGKEQYSPGATGGVLRTLVSRAGACAGGAGRQSRAPSAAGAGGGGAAQGPCTLRTPPAGHRIFAEVGLRLKDWGGYKAKLCCAAL